MNWQEEQIDLLKRGFVVRDCIIAGDEAVLIYPAKSNTFTINWNKDIMQYRTSIWLKNEKKPISCGFPKFFNWGEHVELTPLPTNLNDVILTEKIDGCLNEKVLIETENGIKTIKEICEMKYNGKILSYNVLTNKLEWNLIENWFIIESINDEWYEIELENGNIIQLTGNHKIWLPELKCYRRVDQLNGTEKILIKD